MKRMPIIKWAFLYIDRDGLPSRGHADVGVAIVVPVVVDVQAVRIKVADVDPVAVRVDMLPAPVRATGT